jgi:uncharacterized protein YprB with RNaseH-like and TPR domain
MPSLSDKLKSLGVKVGASEVKPPVPAGASHSVDTVADGVWIETIYGKTYRMDQAFAPDYVHGEQPLSLNAPLGLVGEWAHVESADQIPTENIYFLDTETSGLSGGTGTFAFLVGIGHFSKEGFRFTQFFLQDPSAEPALLAALSEYLTDCQALVTFNGKSFDAPILATRYALHNIHFPLRGTAHLDMLPLSRRLWKDRLPSRRLGFLENILLGVERMEDEVPGYLVPQIYFDYLHTRDARPLKGVFYHNTVDVISLAGLFSFILETLDRPSEKAVSESTDLIAVARLLDDLGYPEKAADLYEIGLKSLTPDNAIYLDTLERVSRLYRRRSEPDKAIEKWEAGVTAGDLKSAVELAKYYEHTLRDYAGAARWTEQAMELVDRQNYSTYLRKQTLADLQHRLDRIVRMQKKEG